jgi:23S rRNA (uracil1939-C5)-methyltransferase
VSITELLHTDEHDSPKWQQGELIEVEITDLSDTVMVSDVSTDRVVFVPDTVPGDRASIRLLHVKPKYAHAKLHSLITTIFKTHPP